MAYLERRKDRGVLLAVHDIPADLRDIIGRRRFQACLKSRETDKARLELRALEADWRNRIEAARNIQRGAGDVAYWHSVLAATANDAEREAVEGVMRDRLGDAVERGAATLAGARRTFGLATGALVKLDDVDNLDAYLKTLHIEPRSKEARRGYVRRFAEAFPHLSDVTQGGVQRWADGLIRDGAAIDSVRRWRTEIKGYWDWLVSRDIAKGEFPTIKLPKASAKRQDEEGRVNWSGEEIRELHKAALVVGGRYMPEVILIGAYTGARGEDIVGLRVEDVRLVDGVPVSFGCDGKTGFRHVPIHPRLRGVFAELLADAPGGFLFGHLKGDKFGKRWPTMSKRFTDLKRTLPFGADEAKVFHCFRSTVIARLLAARLPNGANVQEFVVASIVGHQHKAMTAGRYGKESRMDAEQLAERMELKHEAIRLLDWGI